MDKEEIIDSIEFNWNCLLTTRAVFSNNDFGVNMQYTCPNFYTDRNIVVTLKWDKLGAFHSKYDPKKLNYWHNANFIIRLCGMLEERGLIQKQIRDKSHVLQLIYKLRNKVGAHQDGFKKPKEKYLHEINQLFCKIGITQMQTDRISNFNLAIDGVMLKIKNALVKEIKGL